MKIPNVLNVLNGRHRPLAQGAQRICGVTVGG